MQASAPLGNVKIDQESNILTLNGDSTWDVDLKKLIIPANQINVRGEQVLAKQHFGPMIEQIRWRCAELNVRIFSKSPCYSRVTLSGSEAAMNDVMDFIVQRTYHAECPQADTLMEAAIGCLPAELEPGIDTIVQHIRQCAYCSWFRQKMLQSDAEDGEVLSKDLRVFEQSHASPLDILLQQRRS